MHSSLRASEIALLDERMEGIVPQIGNKSTKRLNMFFILEITHSSVCTPYNTMKCAQKISENFTMIESFSRMLPPCDMCKLECNQIAYKSHNNYAGIFSKTTLKWLVSINDSWTEQYVKSNFVSVNIFFSELDVSQVTQLLKTSLPELLSNVCGSFGTWIGFTAVAIVELVAFIGTVIWLVCFFVSRVLGCFGAKTEIKLEEGLKRPKTASSSLSSDLNCAQPTVMVEFDEKDKKENNDDN
uniref:Uncharacterized protein n=1 Tax=Ditylenchus dipsaci TaxID=166011 RepID=A0A915D100_9BILA